MRFNDDTRFFIISETKQQIKKASDALVIRDGQLFFF